LIRWGRRRTREEEEEEEKSYAASTTSCRIFLMPNSPPDQCFYHLPYFHSGRFVNQIMILPNFASMTARVFIFVKELRTDASLLSLIASGFNPPCTHSQSAFHCCWPALQN
jgi:hypothetical protein